MMESYGALIIPFATAAVLLLFFQHKTKWWELGIPFLVSVALIAGFKVMGEWSATKDAEFWGGWVVSSHYYEDWNEYIHQTCTRTVSCGKNCTTTQTYDCSYVRNHSEYWSVKDSNGQGNHVTKKTYGHFVKLFGMKPQFVDMKRHYHTNDGDMYQTIWPKTDATFSEVFTEHSYENRVQASRSVFSYRKIGEAEVAERGLFLYPEKVALFDFPSVLGDCGPSTKEANERLRFHNAKLGRSKQVRMWMLCTDSGDPAFGQDQESLWVGGNKNEVVIVKGNGWVHLFSWTDDKTPLIETRDFISKMDSFEPITAVNFLAERVDEGFVRKKFEDFSYLTVETPLWSIIATYIVTLLVNIGLSFWLVNNEFRERGRG